MTQTVSWTFLFLALVFSELGPSGVHAQTVQGVQASGSDLTEVDVTPEEALRLVARLILSGNVSDAASVLAQIKGRTGDPVQEMFLEAQIAIRQDRYATALEIYSDILAQDPAQPRIQLERARLLYEMGRTQEADAAFIALRRSALSANTQAYVDQYLLAIRQRQPWTATFSVAAGYDTNVSAGPDQETVTLFGLPFTLSENARRTEAATAVFSGAGSYRWRLSDTTDVRLTGGLRHSDAEGGTFDDTLVSVQAGPAFSFGKVSASLTAQGSRRWFGGNGFSHNAGAQGIIDFRLASDLQVSAIAYIQSADYDVDQNRDGTVYGGTVRGVKAFGSNQALLMYGGVIAEDTRARPLTNTTVRAGAAFINRWPNGVRLTVRPEIARRYFKGIQPAFGIARRDWRYTGSVELAGPAWSESALSPFVRYTATRNSSTIDFNRYTRHQIQVGVTVAL